MTKRFVGLLAATLVAPAAMLSFSLPAHAAAEDPEAKRVEVTERYREEHANPCRAASRGYVTDVIEPAETHAALALSLRKSLSKRKLRPAKKHGNIPR